MPNKQKRQKNLYRIRSRKTLLGTLYAPMLAISILGVAMRQYEPDFEEPQNLTVRENFQGPKAHGSYYAWLREVLKIPNLLQETANQLRLELGFINALDIKEARIFRRKKFWVPHYTPAFASHEESPQMVEHIVAGGIAKAGFIFDVLLAKRVDKNYPFFVRQPRHDFYPLPLSANQRFVLAKLSESGYVLSVFVPQETAPVAVFSFKPEAADLFLGIGLDADTGYGVARNIPRLLLVAIQPENCAEGLEWLLGVLKYILLPAFAAYYRSQPVAMFSAGGPQYLPRQLIWPLLPPFEIFSNIHEQTFSEGALDAVRSLENTGFAIRQLIVSGVDRALRNLGRDLMVQHNWPIAQALSHSKVLQQRFRKNMAPVIDQLKRLSPRNPSNTLRMFGQVVLKDVFAVRGLAETKSVFQQIFYSGLFIRPQEIRQFDRVRAKRVVLPRRVYGPRKLPLEQVGEMFIDWATALFLLQGYRVGGERISSFLQKPIRPTKTADLLKGAVPRLCEELNRFTPQSNQTIQRTVGQWWLLAQIEKTLLSIQLIPQDDGADLLCSLVEELERLQVINPTKKKLIGGQDQFELQQAARLKSEARAKKRRRQLVTRGLNPHRTTSFLQAISAGLSGENIINQMQPAAQRLGTGDGQLVATQKKWRGASALSAAILSYQRSKRSLATGRLSLVDNQRIFTGRISRLFVDAGRAIETQSMKTFGQGAEQILYAQEHGPQIIDVAQPRATLLGTLSSAKLGVLGQHNHAVVAGSDKPEPCVDRRESVVAKRRQNRDWLMRGLTAAVLLYAQPNDSLTDTAKLLPRPLTQYWRVEIYQHTKRVQKARKLAEETDKYKRRIDSKTILTPREEGKVVDTRTGKKLRRVRSFLLQQTPQWRLQIVEAHVRPIMLARKFDAILRLTSVNDGRQTLPLELRKEFLDSFQLLVIHSFLELPGDVLEALRLMDPQTQKRLLGRVSSARRFMLGLESYRVQTQSQTVLQGIRAQLLLIIGHFPGCVTLAPQLLLDLATPQINTVKAGQLVAGRDVIKQKDIVNRILAMEESTINLSRVFESEQATKQLDLIMGEISLRRLEGAGHGGVGGGAPNELRHTIGLRRQRVDSLPITRLVLQKAGMLQKQQPQIRQCGAEQKQIQGGDDAWTGQLLQLVDKISWSNLGGALEGRILKAVRYLIPEQTKHLRTLFKILRGGDVQPLSEEEMKSPLLQAGAVWVSTRHILTPKVASMDILDEGQAQQLLEQLKHARRVRKKVGLDQAITAAKQLEAKEKRAAKPPRDDKSKLWGPRFDPRVKFDKITGLRVWDEAAPKKSKYSVAVPTPFENIDERGRAVGAAKRQGLKEIIYEKQKREAARRKIALPQQPKQPSEYVVAAEWVEAQSDALAAQPQTAAFVDEENNLLREYLDVNRKTAWQDAVLRNEEHNRGTIGQRELNREILAQDYIPAEVVNLHLEIFEKDPAPRKRIGKTDQYSQEIGRVGWGGLADQLPARSAWQNILLGPRGQTQEWLFQRFLDRIQNRGVAR